MTKWKKSVSLLLAVCMLFTVVPAFAIGGSEGYLDESQTGTPQTPDTPGEDASFAGLLVALGICSDDMLSGELTEENFSKMLAAVIGNDLYVTTSQTPVTYTQAVRMILDATGYSFMLRSKTDGEYLMVANRIKLTKNANGNPLRLLYNTLNLEYLFVNGMKNGYTDYISYDGQTYLTEIHDTVKIDGVLRTVGKKSIVGESDIKASQIQVEGYVLDTAEGLSGLTALLGHTVDAYVKTTGDSQTAVYVVRGDDSTEVLLSSRNLSSATASAVKDNDDKNYRLSSACQMIYNGVPQVEVTPSLFTPYYLDYNAKKGDFSAKVNMTAQIRLVDNNGDKKYDFAIVDAYEIHRVGKVVKKKFYFNDYYRQETGTGSAKVDFSAGGEEDDYITYQKGGKEATISDLKSGDIVSVYASQTSKRKELVISSGSKTGTVEGISRNGDVNIGGTVYQISPYLAHAISNYPTKAQQPKPGDKVTFTLDVNGEIANLTKGASTSDGEYVYIIGANTNSGFASDVQLRVVTKEGEIKVYKGASDMKLDGQSKDASEIKAAIAAKGSHMPAKIKLKNEEITELDLNLSIEKPNSLKFAKSGTGVFTCTQSGSPYLNHVYKIGPNTTFIGIGFDKDNQVNDEYVLKMSANYLEERPVDGVNIDRFNNLFTMVDHNPADDSVGMVIMDIFPNTKTENWVLPDRNSLMNEYTPFHLTDHTDRFLMVVNDVGQGINQEDEVTDFVTGLYMGQEQSFALASDVVYEVQRKDFSGYSSETAGVTMWTPDAHILGWSPKVRPGDILNVVFNEANEISEVIWVSTATAVPVKGNNYRSIRQYMQWGGAYGYVMDNENGIVRLNVSSDGTDSRRDVANGFEILQSKMKYIYQYNYEKERFEVAEFDDISPSDSVLDVSYDYNPGNAAQANNVWVYSNIHHWEGVEAVVMNFSEICNTK